MVPSFGIGIHQVNSSIRQTLEALIKGVLSTSQSVQELRSLKDIDDWLSSEKSISPKVLFTVPDRFSKVLQESRIGKTALAFLVVVTAKGGLKSLGTEVDPGSPVVLLDVSSQSGVRKLRKVILSLARSWAESTVLRILTKDDRAPVSTPPGIDDVQSYMHLVRSYVNATSVTLYSLSGTGEYLRVISSSGPSPIDRISYGKIKKFLEFNENPVTELFSNAFVRRTLGSRAARWPDTFLASTYLYESGLPTLILFQLSAPIDPPSLQELCRVAARELRHEVRRWDLERRYRCLAALPEAQVGLPEKKKVLWEICRQLKSYFGVEGVSISLVKSFEGSMYTFEKTYVHHNRELYTEFKADHGYTVQCVNNRKALLITGTADDANPPYGEGLEFELDKIRVGAGKPTRVPYVLPPDTVEDEKSLMICPIVKYSEGEGVVGTLKVGSFSQADAFLISQLAALQTFAVSIPPLLFAADIGEQLNKLKHLPELSAKLLEHADTLFHYREIALGLFHQIGNCLHAIQMAMLDAEGLCSRPTLPSDLFRKIVDTSKVEIKKANSLITRAQKRGHSLEPLLSECSLLEEIVRPAIKRINAGLGNVEWKVTHSLGSVEYIMYVDAELAVESLINVLANSVWAVKNNRRNTYKQVFVAVRELEGTGRLKIEISDTGLGIAPEDQKSIFDPFFTTRGPEGTGLGLYFAKRLIEAFDGTIDLGRSTLNKGTTIVITLPFLERKR